MDCTTTASSKLLQQHYLVLVNDTGIFCALLQSTWSLKNYFEFDSKRNTVFSQTKNGVLPLGPFEQLLQMRQAQFETVPPPTAMGLSRRYSYLSIAPSSFHLEPPAYREDT